MMPINDQSIRKEGAFENHAPTPNKESLRTTVGHILTLTAEFRWSAAYGCLMHVAILLACRLQRMWKHIHSY